jgi:hypothetical protein
MMKLQNIQHKCNILTLDNFFPPKNVNWVIRIFYGIRLIVLSTDKQLQ